MVEATSPSQQPATVPEPEQIGLVSVSEVAFEVPAADAGHFLAVGEPSICGLPPAATSFVFASAPGDYGPEGLRLPVILNASTWPVLTRIVVVDYDEERARRVHS